MPLNDEAVLNAIFNPNLPYSTLDDGDEPSSSPAQGSQDEALSAEEAECTRLEVSGVAEAEKGNVDEAIELFSRAIRLAPEKPSGYNNRAQAYRLKGNVLSALEDLNKAVEISAGKGKAGCGALCQRAMVHRLRGHEDEAMGDLKLAAANGSKFAKNQLVKLNPYAALCNQMLGDMMAKLLEGTECSEKDNEQATRTNRILTSSLQPPGAANNS